MNDDKVPEILPVVSHVLSLPSTLENSTIKTSDINAIQEIVNPSDIVSTPESTVNVAPNDIVSTHTMVDKNIANGADAESSHTCPVTPVFVVSVPVDSKISSLKNTGSLSFENNGPSAVESLAEPMYVDNIRTENNNIAGVDSIASGISSLSIASPTSTKNENNDVKITTIIPPSTMKSPESVESILMSDTPTTKTENNVPLASTPVVTPAFAAFPVVAFAAAPPTIHHSVYVAPSSFSAAAETIVPDVIHWSGTFSGHKTQDAKCAVYVEGCVFVKHYPHRQKVDVFIMHEKAFNTVNLVVSLPVIGDFKKGGCSLPDIGGAYMGTKIEFNVDQDMGKRVIGKWKTSHAAVAMGNLTGVYEVKKTAEEEMQPFENQNRHKILFDACTIC